MSRQTTIQDITAIRKGSVRILIGDDAGSLVDIGALRNPAIESLTEKQNIKFDNVRDLRKFVMGDQIKVTFDLAEINFTNLAKLDGGMIVVTAIPGVLVNDAIQLVVAGGWNYNTFIEFANQNGNGSAPNVDSVTAATDGVLVSETDYFVGQNGAGKWGIYVKDSVTVTTLAQNLTIQYDYTPNASKRVTFNESGTATEKYMRIINVDEAGREFRLDINQGTNFAPFSIDFAGDEEDDVAILPVDFQGHVVEYVDEQQVA